MISSGQRKCLFVDAHVQGALVRQIMWHWGVACVVTILYLVVLESLMSGMGGTFAERLSNVLHRYAPLVIVVLTLLPIFLLDSIKLSHRFVGPMISLKKSLRKLADGEPTRPLQFRDGDFWRELTGDFNRVAERMGLSIPQSPPTKRPEA